MTWLLVAIVVVGLLAYGLRSTVSAGPSGNARCRECNQLFDNTEPQPDVALAWREWGVVLCPSCARKRENI